MTAAEYRATARDRLDNKWGLAVGTSFVATLLGATGMTSSSGVPSITNVLDDTDLGRLFGDNFYYSESFRSSIDAAPAITVIIASIAFILSVVAMVDFILGGPVQLGFCKFNRNLYMKNEAEPAQFNDLFDYFNIFGKAFITKFLVTLFIVLWSMLLIIPGIIMSFAYSMTFYIMQEHPELSSMEAIQASRELMKGHKWDLFCLQFSFIGWYFLSVISLGIGTIVLKPYVEQAIYAFYYDISRNTVPTVNEATNGN